jgi:hypothetical protein
MRSSQSEQNIIRHHRSAIGALLATLAIAIPCWPAADAQATGERASAIGQEQIGYNPNPQAVERQPDKKEGSLAVAAVCGVGGLAIGITLASAKPLRRRSPRY